MEDNKPANILLVDDHEDALLVLEATLGSLGQNLVRAQSGREALKQVLSTDFAVILLDVQMPLMDGFETAKLIRQREQSSTIPIVFITAGYRTEDYIFEGYAVGAVDYILKPFAPEVLRSKVRIFVDLWRKNADLRHLNAMLERQAADLARVNKNLTAFAYTVSHDLQAPLRIIDGFAKAVLEDYQDKLGLEGRDMLERICHATSDMIHMVRNILAFYRAGQQELKISDLDMGNLVRLEIDKINLTHSGRNIKFNVEELLPAHGDIAAIRQVWFNLLSNAVKFTQKKPEPVIEVGCKNKVGRNVYYIKDNGAGFDMKDKDKLFEPFHRLHSEIEFKGTGVGLATVSRIIEMHGGKIWAEGEVGEGATFYFTLSNGR